MARVGAPRVQHGGETEARRDHSLKPPPLKPRVRFSMFASRAAAMRRSRRAASLAGSSLTSSREEPLSRAQRRQAFSSSSWMCPCQRANVSRGGFHADLQTAMGRVSSVANPFAEALAPACKGWERPAARKAHAMRLPAHMRLHIPRHEVAHKVFGEFRIAASPSLGAPAGPHAGGRLTSEGRQPPLGSPDDDVAVCERMRFLEHVAEDGPATQRGRWKIVQRSQFG